MVKKEILEANPLPAHKRIQTLKFESDIVNLLPVRSRPGATKQDHNANCSPQKMVEVLGPLSKALVDKPKRKGPEIKLARLIEKSVLCSAMPL